LGVVPTADALQMARERDVDLVEVAPNSVPPVCRMLDFGKYKYEQAKKDRNASKHQHAGGGLHEVRFKVKIGEHDLDLKMRRAEEFLREGDKVKLSVMFRGREILHPEIGQKLLQRVREKLAEVAVAERPPAMEGRFMNMFMAPLSAKNRPQKERPPAAVEAGAEG
jgi:translation initiation factor IF-3